MLTEAFGCRPPKDSSRHSPITRARISASLTGKRHSDLTRASMSASRSGPLNRLYGKSLPKHVLDAAAIKAGTAIYVYDADSFALVNGMPFRSIRDTVKHMPISPDSVSRYLDTGKPFKGYFYFTIVQTVKPC